MKKFKLAAILVVLVLVLALVMAGCGGSKAPEPTPAGDKSAAEPAKETYPAGKSIKVIVGFGPGGTTDTSMRGIQPFMQKYLNTTVLVENMAGSNGLIACNYVYDQKPDGYTLIETTNGMVLRSALDEKAFKSGKPLHETFKPIYAFVNADGNGILVKKESPIKSMDDLAALAQKQTVKVAVSGGISSTDMVSCLIMKKTYGGNWIFLPLDSSAEVVTRVLGGSVDCGVGGPAGSAMDPDKLRMLAVTNEKRSTRWPDTPTFGELGKPELTSQYVIGIGAHPDTPPEILKILEDAMVKARSDADYLAWAKNTNQAIGDEGWGSAKYAEFLKSYYDQMLSIIPEMKAEMEKSQAGKK